MDWGLWWVRQLGGSGRTATIDVMHTVSMGGFTLPNGAKGVVTWAYLGILLNHMSSCGDTTAISH